MLEIQVDRDRRRDKHSPTMEGKKSCADYKYSAHVGLALSAILHSTVERMLDANYLLHQMRQESKAPLRTHALHAEDELMLTAWCDASLQIRHDGGSTEGIFIGIGRLPLGRQVAKVTPVFWTSGRSDRARRFAGSAETG